MRLPIWVIWIAAAAVIYALLAFLASRSVYYPIRYPGGLWQLGRQLGTEDVFITTADGVKLHGWLIKRPEARLMTLHLHGNGGNITHRTLTASHILAAGSSILLLDYRGYGRSEGRPTESGLYKDAEAAYDFLLQSGYRPEQIVLHGESLGTAVAVDLAVRRKCAGLVLEAPLTSARAVAGRVLPLLGPLLISGFDTKSKIRRVSAPVLIIHGDRDEVIAYEFGKELLEEAPEPKSMWTIPGATHNDLHVVGGVEFVPRLKTFYATLREGDEDHAEARPPDQGRRDQ